MGGLGVRSFTHTINPRARPRGGNQRSAMHRTLSRTTEVTGKSLEVPLRAVGATAERRAGERPGRLVNRELGTEV